MKPEAFDSLSRGVTRTDRRSALAFAVAVGAAFLGGPAATAAPDAAACVASGVRCGGRNQPKCKRCCSQWSVRRPNTGQRRCTCRAALTSCRRDDQCCEGFCDTMPCAGIDTPSCIPSWLYVSTSRDSNGKRAPLC